MASERRRDADWYEQELKRQELAAARRLTGVLPSGEAPRPVQLAQAGKVMDRSLRELGRLRHSLEGELERVQGRSRPGGEGSEGRGRRQPAASRRLHPEVPRYYAVRNAIDEVLERWERRRDQLSAAAGGRHAAPEGTRQPSRRSKGQPSQRGKDPARARR